MIFSHMKCNFDRYTLWITPFLLLGTLYKILSDVTGYQDSETLLQAADSLSQRKNPYENSFFLNGYVLAKPAQLLSSPFSPMIGARIYVILNFLLLILVILDICKKIPAWKTILVIFAVVASSPSRAMASNVQHTGLILGFSYFAYKLACAPKPDTKIKIFARNFSVSLMLLPTIELKPQLILPLIAVFVFNQKLRIYIFYCSAMVLISHIIISTYFKMPLDKFWLERLFTRSSETTSIESRENSPWTLISNLTGYSNLWLGISAVLFLSLTVWLIFYSRNRVLSLKVFYIALSVPLVLSYIHPYDLIVPVILVSYIFTVDSKFHGSFFYCLSSCFRH